MTQRNAPQLQDSRPWRPERSQLEIDLDLRTNIEVRAAYLVLRRTGMTQHEASQALGRVGSWGSWVDVKPRPEIIRSTSGWVKGQTPTCSCCGKTRRTDGQVASRGATHDRGYVCSECLSVDHESRHSILIRHAETTGFVPSVRDVMEILGIGRSVAGDELERAFGPDPRVGSERRRVARPYQAKVPA